MDPKTSMYRVKAYKPTKKEELRKPPEPYKPKIYDIANKELVTEHGPVIYKPIDPNIDPLTGLPYNHVPETRERLKRTKVAESKKLPITFGSPVKSISRTLKLIDSLVHQVDTTSIRFQDLERRQNPIQAKATVTSDIVSPRDAMLSRGHSSQLGRFRIYI